MSNREQRKKNILDIFINLEYQKLPFAKSKSVSETKPVPGLRYLVTTPSLL